LQKGAVRGLDEQQSGLSLHLRVVQRTLGERDRRALTVDDPLSGRMPVGSCALEPSVQRSKGKLVALAVAEQVHRQERRRYLRTRRQTRQQGGLDPAHRQLRGSPAEQQIVGIVKRRNGLEATVTVRLFAKAL